MKVIMIAAAIGLFTGSPLAAQANAPSDQSVKKADPKKIVCEAEETIGSRLGKRRVCMTLEEWNDKHNEHREFTENIQSGTWGRDSAVQVQAPMLQGMGPQ